MASEEVPEEARVGSAREARLEGEYAGTIFRASAGEQTVASRESIVHAIVRLVPTR